MENNSSSFENQPPIGKLVLSQELTSIEPPTVLNPLPEQSVEENRLEGTTVSESGPYAQYKLFLWWIEIQLVYCKFAGKVFKVPIKAVFCGREKHKT